MKPITLKISGLHSFREEQEIDFEQLGGLGVFGIFGPTGSGKSSILDAMTLALYGTVLRAGRRTQGILNHAEKQVKVAFTFTLKEGSKRHCYRVERRYTRKDQLTVANTYSRLVLVHSEAEKVLADKERDVTEQITALLGLREEDFTRAVVLPQGKFAEFLNLGGKERREMLQRLFSLEQYGNVLLNKINEQHRVVEVSYIEIESEQKGLGDASPAAVADAEAAFAAARQVETSALAQFKAAEQQYQAASEIYNLQNELAKIQLEQAEHRRRQQEINELSAALKQAEKAERAAVVMEEFFAAQKAEQTAAAAKHQIAAKVDQLTDENKRLSAVYSTAREARLKQEPDLIERRTKLLSAVTLEQEASRLANEAADLAKQQQEKQRALQEVSQSEEYKVFDNQKILNNIKNLEQELSTAAVSAGRRNDIQLLQALAQTVTQNKLAMGKLEAERNIRQQQYSNCRLAAVQAEEKLRQSEQRLTEQEEIEAETADEQLKAAIAKLDQLLSSEKQAAAIRLAGLLSGGSPCPVCGSLDHPQPANTGNRDGQDYEQIDFEQAITSAREQVAGLTLHISKLTQKAAAERHVLNKEKEAAVALAQQAVGAKIELDKIDSEYQAAQASVAASYDQLITALQKQGVDGELSAAAAVKQVDELTAVIRRQDELAERLTKKLVSTRLELAVCQEEISSLQRKIQLLKTDLAALTARLRSIEEQLAARRQELVTITAGIPTNQLLTRVAHTLETVRLAEQQAQNDYERVAENLAEAEQTRAGIESTWQEAIRRRESLTARFAAKLQEEGFTNSESVTKALLSSAHQEEYRQKLSIYTENDQRLTIQCEQLANKLRGRSIAEAEWQVCMQKLADDEKGKNAAVELRVEADKELRDLTEKYQRWAQLESKRRILKERRDCLQALKTLLRGNVFIEFLAQEQMELVAWQASERLKEITQQRYALEMSSDGGFLIRDDCNGGVKRPVGTLSGGETFQTSLALALALSAQIQLKGKYPLEFFFLDEGFGSLDQQALDVAMATLEKLHIENLTIGIISHVAELKQRMPRRLLVEPAEPAGRGSRVKIEEA